MSARDDLLAGLPAQDAGDVRRAETLADAGDAREDLARQDDWLGRGFELVRQKSQAPQPSFGY